MKKVNIFKLAAIIAISAASINQLNAQEMNSKKVTAGRDRLGALAPKFAELNDDVLFGQVWSREEELSARDRSLVTIVSLIAGGNFEQLKSHLQRGKGNGLSKQEIAEIITHQAFYVGWPKAWSAFNIVKEVYADSDTTKHTILEKSTIFPLGEPVNPQWFTGEAWLKMISTDNPINARIANVTFAPGCRNHWHSHKIGQILLVTGGEGWYQEWGKPAQKLKEGDVVNIPANVKHWHGATRDSWFVHLAITPGESEWFEPVADEEYNRLQNTATTAPQSPAANHKVRLSKITVDPAQLDSYNAYLKEGIEAAVSLEAGVLTLFAVAEKENPNQITILEIYADEAAYSKHIQTPHFLKYKQGTLDMVQSLELINTSPLIPGLKIK